MEKDGKFFIRLQVEKKKSLNLSINHFKKNLTSFASKSRWEIQKISQVSPVNQGGKSRKSLTVHVKNPEIHQSTAGKACKIRPSTVWEKPESIVIERNKIS